MKTRLTGFVLVLSLLLVPKVSAQGQNSVSQNENKNSNFGMGLEFKFFDVSSFPVFMKEVDNVPLALRQVPSHPDDTWIYGNQQVMRTIPFDSINPSGFESLNFTVSPELTLWRFRLRSGLMFSYASFGGAEPKNEGSTREINQYGVPERGYGTSLVYYSIYGRNSWKPGVITEADLNIYKGFLAMVGYGWSNYNLVTETGYDRYDALEQYRAYDLGSARSVRRYLGGGWSPDVDNGWRPITIYVVYGKTRTEINLSGLAEGMTFQPAGNPWFIEFGFAYHGIFLKK